MKRMIAVIAGLAAFGLLAASVAHWPAPLASPTAGEGGALSGVQAVLTAPRFVPPPVDRPGPARVVVSIETKEHTGTHAAGVRYTFWTFGDTVPGPFIRVRAGDLVELRLSNSPGSRNPHSIDLHAVTGPGGGAAVTQLGPGQEGAVQWKALNPGLYVYHCAPPHVPTHIANGMYGLILVEPPQGLSRVDREYYVMQGEFYTRGKTLQAGHQPLDAAKLAGEQPEYVVFNGRIGSLLDQGALRARVGETVRLFVGNGGPDLVSSFHVIGEIFDRVWAEAAIGGAPAPNVQTTLVPAGGAAIVEMRMDVPGRYLLVDHSISRAMDRGALGAIEVSGPEPPAVFRVLGAGTRGDGGH
jgi:nitrite reductase (NO-forming)